MNLSKEILLNSRRIHFIGIGGIGMSGLAEYYLRHGVKVSGSDLSKSASTDRLIKLGVDIAFSHSKDNIQNDSDVVVYTSAMKEDNEEYNEAKNRGLKLLKRSQMLGLTVNDKKLIAVAGTHGKTTTTAMIGKVLTDLGYDPTIFVGGNTDYLDGASSRVGDGEYAVVEADEYDRSFLTLKPDTAVITNIDFDHSDIYSDETDLKYAFTSFASNIKPGGVLIGFSDDKMTSELLTVITKTGKLSYGTGQSADFRISGYMSSEKGSEFEINGVSVSLGVHGLHNVYNATGAYAALNSSAGLSCEDFAGSIKSFTGVDRRLELKYSNGVKVYDDYAHHPAEVEASFEAVRNFTKGKVITVFQPHLYSRTKKFYREFADSLGLSDDVYLMEIYPARETPIEGVSSEMIANVMFEKFGRKPNVFSNRDEVYGSLLNDAKDGDVIIFQGAGDITNVCDDFVRKLKGQTK